MIQAAEPIKGRGAQINPHNPFHNIVREEEVRIIDNEKIKTSYIPNEAKSIVNKVDSPDLNFNYSINPYQGCEHGCIYCYARNTHTYWGYSAGMDFESKIMVKENAPDLLDKFLRRKSWKAEPIMLSGNTDCYQPAEKDYMITRKMLEVFYRHRHPVSITTKNSLILRDLDILEKLAKKNLVRVYISVTTMNEDIRRMMEPRTASGIKRIKTIEELSRAGVPVGAMLAPIIPGLNDVEIMKMAKLSAAAGAQALTHSIVRLNGQVAEIFKDWVKKSVPLKADRIISQIESCHEGKLNDSRFHDRQKGTGKIADMINQQMRLAKMMYFKNRKFPMVNRMLHNQMKQQQLSLF